MNSQIVKACALLVPTLILGGTSVLHAYNQRNGILWQVAITGYDPRDLLSGHYLQFRYDWNLIANEFETQLCQDTDCVLCASDPQAFNPSVVLQQTELAAAQCPSFIAGSLDPAGNFMIAGDREALTRYYIPESEAARLDALLRNQDENSPRFSMGLRVNRAGEAFVDTLYVDGTPLNEWLEQK